MAHLLQCRPSYFDVTYAINPWMDPSDPVDTARARQQWKDVQATYERLGHTVSLLEPAPDLPDLVFTANAGFVVGDTVLLARFRHAERWPETPLVRDWFLASGWSDVRQSDATFEGEGDAVLLRDEILAAVGPRTDREAHEELAATFGLPVTTVELEDPRYYHLDTAFAPVTDDLIAWYPAAFTDESRRLIERRFPRQIVANRHDAEALGVNLVSDGEHVLVAAQAGGLIEDLRAHGLTVHPVDVSEFRKSGGGIKCVTLDLHQ